MSEQEPLAPAPACRVCQLPLGQIEINLKKQWHFSCDVCSFCGADGLQDSRIAECLKHEIPVSHLGCYNTRMEQELKNKEVTITQGHLDWLNRMINLFWIESDDSPEMDLSLEALSQKVDLDARYVVQTVKEMDYERAAKILTKMQSLTAAFSIATHHNREKANLKIRQRDIDKFKEVKEYRDGKVKADTQRKVDERTRVEKQNQLAAERENPELRERRKAIEGLAKTLGWNGSKDDPIFKMAESMVLEQEAKRAAGKEQIQ